MRQRLSSEPDRYRGRRRVPTPPRSRYAAVVTTALVGAGVVAIGAGSLPDAKTVSPSSLQDLQNAATGEDLAARAAEAERATRANERAESGAVDEAGAWRLPLRPEDGLTDNPVVSEFGDARWAAEDAHTGVDLAAAEGTPYYAVHAGVVEVAKYEGGYGYHVLLDHGDGTKSLYAHSSALAVRAGQQVKAGELLGRVGNTGNSYGPHLHLEIHVNGNEVNPLPVLESQGVDVKEGIDGSL